MYYRIVLYHIIYSTCLHKAMCYPSTLEKEDKREGRKETSWILFMPIAIKI